MISEPCAVCNCPIPPTFAIATPAFFLSFGPTTSPLTQNCDLLGPALKPIWSWLRRQTRPEMPWQHLAWRALHCGWHQPARQHDVGEYLAFLKPHLGVAACGTWESRLHMSNQPVRCVESGDTWPLLLQTPLEGQLHPPATSISLQSLLDTWSLSQEGKPGLVRVPAVLCLQINRFNTGLHLDPKSSLSVEPEPQLLVPSTMPVTCKQGTHCSIAMRCSADLLQFCILGREAPRDIIDACCSPPQTPQSFLRKITSQPA